MSARACLCTRVCADSAIGVARSSYRSRGSFVLAATGGGRHLEERISARRASSWWPYRRIDVSILKSEASGTGHRDFDGDFRARACEIGASRGETASDMYRFGDRPGRPALG